MFPRLSKLLSQEDALGTPWLRGKFCSQQAASSRGAPMLRTGVIRHFDVTFTVCYTRVTMLVSADVYPVVVADARAECAVARPSSAVVAGRHRRQDLSYKIVRFWACVDRLGRYFL
jgi:hypothetical protein